MSPSTEDETLSEAERLISEYRRNTASTRDKINSIHAFNCLWESADSKTDYAGMLRGMRHVGFLPLIMETLTSGDLVAMDRVELQIFGLAGLLKFFRCCSEETPNPGPMLFKQFEASVPEVFDRSFKMIEEKIQEHYIFRLQLNLLRTFIAVSEFFVNVDRKPQIIQHIDISKILDTLWGSCFAPVDPSPDVSSARNWLFLGDYPLAAIALENVAPSWDKVYCSASLTRAIAQYGPERIAHRIKEVCEDPQTPTKAINIRTVGEMIGLFAVNHRAVEVEIIKAGLPKGLIRAYWAWLCKTDEKGKEPEADLPQLIFQTIYPLLHSSSKAAGHETLLKKIVQDLLDEDFMMIVGRALVAAQYEEKFVITGLFFKGLFEEVFKQVYGAKCEDRELWHSFSHVLNCARAYCRVHGDPLVLRGGPISEYRPVTYLWHSLGMSIGVREDIWWNEFVWCKLPLEVRKMGCNWMKCPVFGMDYMDTLTAGPTPLVCSKCREVFYCSMECQKQDWNQGTHRRQCLGKELSVTPSRGGTMEADP